MADDPRQASEELFALLDGHVYPEFDDPGTVTAALDYVESVLSSDIELYDGRSQQTYDRVSNAYAGLVTTAIRRLEPVANVATAMCYHDTMNSLGRNLVWSWREYEWHLDPSEYPSPQLRDPWLDQLACVRRLAETGFAALPDRLVRIEQCKFYYAKPKRDGSRRYDVKAVSMDAIRLSRDDMDGDGELEAFDRLVAIDARDSHCRPRPVQYLLPDPKPVDEFRAERELWARRWEEKFGGDEARTHAYLREADEYAETIHMMRVKATELAGARRGDLPVNQLCSCDKKIGNDR